MTIHHATLKRAQKLGFLLTEVEQHGATVVEGLWAEQNQRYTHRDPKTVIDALTLEKTLRAEYPVLTLWQDKKSGDFVAATKDRHITEGSETVPQLADVLEAAQALGIDLEEDEDTDAPNEVVPAYFRQQYRERGNPNHCGDWLAQQLENRFRMQEDGKEVFDVPKFTETLVLNGVDMTGKWAGLPTSGQKGWIGRYRMNGRQKLEVRVAITGELKLNDTVLLVPETDLATLRTKHAKAVAKANKDTVEA